MQKHQDGKRRAPQRSTCDDILLDMKIFKLIQERFVKEHDLLLKVAAGQIAATPFIAYFLRHAESDSGHIATILIITLSLIFFFLLLLGKFFEKSTKSGLVAGVGISMLLTLFVSIALLIHMLCTQLKTYTLL